MDTAEFRNLTLTSASRAKAEGFIQTYNALIKIVTDLDEKAISVLPAFTTDVVLAEQVFCSDDSAT